MKSPKPQENEPRLRREQALFDRWSLLLLTLTALLLRLYQLGEWSFWEDEVFTIRDMNYSLGQLLSLEGKTRHVLFPILQKGFLPLLPLADEGAHRLLAALFGTASVPILFCFGRSLVGRRGALIASLFLTICPWHIYWSQNCRYYTLTALLSLLTAWAFWAALQRRRSLGFLLLTLLLAGLSAFSHPSAAFLLGGLTLFMLTRLLQAKGAAGRTRRQQGWTFLFLVGLGTLVLSLFLMPALEGFQRAKAATPLSHLAHTLVFYIGPGLLVMAFLGWFGLRRRAREEADFLAYQVLVPLVAITLLGFLVRVTAQYLFFTLPFYALLAGWGTAALLERSREGRKEGMLPPLHLAGLLLVLLPYLAQGYLYYRYESGWRLRWREAATRVRELARDRDQVAVTNAAAMEYYLNPDFYQPGNQHRRTIPLQNWDIREKLDQLLAEDVEGRCFLVVHRPVMQEKDPAGRQWQRVREHMRLAAFIPAWSGPRDMNLFIFLREE